MNRSVYRLTELVLHNNQHKVTEIIYYVNYFRIILYVSAVKLPCFEIDAWLQE
jgi:hypothetical protein